MTVTHFNTIFYHYFSPQVQRFKAKLRFCALTIMVLLCGHSSKKKATAASIMASQSHLFPKSSSCHWWLYTSTPQQYIPPKPAPLPCACPQNKCSWVVPVNKTSTPPYRGYGRQVPLGGGCWKIKACVSVYQRGRPTHSRYKINK